MIFDEVFLNSLCHTTHDSDNEFAVASLAECVERFKTVKDFLLGIVAHRTSIEHHHLRVLKGLGRLVACGLHNSRYNLAVSHIHLAAICLNVVFLHNGLQSYEKKLN